MADGKNKRTKYSLHRNIPVEIPAGLDQLCDPEGARIINGAGEPTVDGVVGPSPSTLFSAIGSLFMWVFFFLFAWNIFKAYKRDPPQINEQTLDTPRDFGEPLPDFALTLSLTPRDFYIASQIRQIKAAPGSSVTWIDARDAARTLWYSLSEDEQILQTCNKSKCENRTLEYLWPVFRWESISNGFEKKEVSEVHTLLGREDGVRFGDDCRLNANTDIADGRWPVFCFLNSELPPERQRMLRGRDFGDPLWSYLDVRIVRCTNMSDFPRATDPYTNVSMPYPEAWSGTCAPYDDIDALVDEYEGKGLGVNLFFKSPQEPDWTESRWNRPAGQPADNSMERGWTMHEYRQMSSSSHVACRLYLKHTEAYVNDPQSFGFSNFMPYLSWFDFDRSDCFRSHLNDARFEEYGTLYRWDKGQDENRTRFFDISVRMNHKRRKIEVRRQNILEMLSDIGGSWEPAFFLGWLVVVVINRALMAASACPRDREEWDRTFGRGASKVAAAEAPAPASAAEAAAPAPATEASVRSLWSVRSRSSSRSLVPESPAPPPLDPRKFAELLERVRKLEEQVQNS